MNRWGIRSVLGMTFSAVLAASTVLAHITPPVVLTSDREAVLTLLAGAQKFSVREVRLSEEERAAIQKQWGWNPAESFYRFYLGRDGQGRLVAAAIFITEVTIHGPVRVAVGLSPDGKIKGAIIAEVTEETYQWVRPLIDQEFSRDYVGQDSRGRFGLSERVMRVHLEAMPQFYGQVIGSMVQRGAILYEVTVQKRGAAV